VLNYRTPKSSKPFPQNSFTSTTTVTSHLRCLHQSRRAKSKSIIGRLVPLYHPIKPSHHHPISLMLLLLSTPHLNWSLIKARLIASSSWMQRSSWALVRIDNWFYGIIVLWRPRKYYEKLIIVLNLSVWLAEIISLCKVSETMVASGAKNGEIKLWRRVDAAGNFIFHKLIHHHEKCKIYLIWRSRLLDCYNREQCDNGIFIRWS